VAENDRIETTLDEIARRTGAEVQRYPQRGKAVRTVVLRDLRDEGGSRYLVASLEEHGALRVSGRDDGPAVSRAWGPSITTYEWVYVVPAERVDNVVAALGGGRGDDVLSLLATRCQAGEDIEAALRSSEVAAEFANWHS
jgi:hypothetical protein